MTRIWILEKNHLLAKHLHVNLMQSYLPTGVYRLDDLHEESCLAFPDSHMLLYLFREMSLEDVSEEFQFITNSYMHMHYPQLNEISTLKDIQSLLLISFSNQIKHK